jgi:hypothetical protein
MHSPGRINLELKSSAGSSDSCSESDSEGLSTAQLSENEGSFDSFKSNNERWTVKEVQTLKRCASMVKNGEASWEDVAAALNSTGSERTIIAVRCCFTCCPSATRCSVLLSRMRIPIVVLV